ncbi:MAG: EAL domain-containing protein [Gammaproteobacteria bacterium]
MTAVPVVSDAPAQPPLAFARRNFEHLVLTTSLTAGGTLCAAAGVVFLLRGSLPLPPAIAWFAAVALTVFLRVHGARRCRSQLAAGRTPDMLAFDYPLVLVGLSWSVGAVALPRTLFGDMLMMLCLFGLVAGAVAGFASRPRSVLCLALPAVLPFSAAMMLAPDPTRRILGVALLLFSTLLLVAGLRMGRLVREAYGHEAANAALVEDLTRHATLIERLNDELETRVRLRTDELNLLVDELSERSDELEQSRRRYRDIVELTGELILSVDRHGRLLFANDAALRALALDRAARAHGASLTAHVAADSRADFRAALEDVLAGAGARPLEFALQAGDGDRVTLSGTLQAGFEGGDTAAFGVFRDISAELAATAALESSEARFQAIFARSSISIMILDAELDIIEANARAHTMLSRPSGTLRGNAVRTIVGPAHRTALERDIRTLLDGAGDSLELELECTRSGQDPFWARLDLSTVADASGKPRFVALILHDISERKALADANAYHASHDYLTGLLNRRAFEQRLGELVETAPPHGRHALVFFDLDRFKLINDTCGHSTGDALLRRLAADLGAIVPHDCVLARIGGDEFALLVPDASAGEAQVVARAVLKCIDEFRFEYEGRTHTIGASAGIVLLRGGESVDEAMQSADAACYAAKRSGRNRIELYNADQSDMRLQRDQVRAVSQLADALEAGRLRLYAQPVAAIGETAPQPRIAHYELLLRLHDTDGSLSGAGELIPAAEKYGYASEVDQWVVRTTLETLATLPDATAAKLRLAINLATQSLQSERFEEFLAAQLRTHPFGEQLCFEITESEFMSNFERAARFIRRMRHYGCRFALDDFGTGFSSYGYLKELDVDFLKIDGTFIRAVDANPVDEAIVRSIAGVARAMRMQTIAEYVERPEQVSVLRRVGIDFVQGYAVGHEKPLAEVVTAAGSTGASAARR